MPILFSYGGWQNANVLAEEIREPRRTLPRALVAGTLIVIAVYVLVNVVYLATLGRDGLAATATPAANAVQRLFGAGAERWIAATIAVSTFGFLDLTLLGPTRIYYAMARDGVFFPGLSNLHPRFGTPHRAILLQAGWAIVLLLTGTFGDLVDSVVFADWIFFALTIAAVMRFRRRFPPAQRGPRAYLSPGYPILPILFIAASLLVLAGVVRVNPKRSAIGVVLIAAGPARLLRVLRPREASEGTRRDPRRGALHGVGQGAAAARDRPGGQQPLRLHARRPARSARGGRHRGGKPGGLRAARRGHRGALRRGCRQRRDGPRLLGRELSGLRGAARSGRRGAGRALRSTIRFRRRRACSARR